MQCKLPCKKQALDLLCSQFFDDGAAPGITDNLGFARLIKTLKKMASHRLSVKWIAIKPMHVQVVFFLNVS